MTVVEQCISGIKTEQVTTYYKLIHLYGVKQKSKIYTDNLQKLNING